MGHGSRKPQQAHCKIGSLTVPPGWCNKLLRPSSVANNPAWLPRGPGREVSALIRKSGPRWVMAEEGGHAVFSCSGDGDPAPTVSWMRPQGVRLGRAGRVRVLQDGTLEIRSVQLRDRGAYVCVVSNVAGNDSLRTWLEVIQVEPPNGTLSDPNSTSPCHSLQQQNK